MTAPGGNRTKKVPNPLKRHARGQAWPGKATQRWVNPAQKPIVTSASLVKLGKLYANALKERSGPREQCHSGTGPDIPPKGRSYD